MHGHGVWCTSVEIVSIEPIYDAASQSVASEEYVASCGVLESDRSAGEHRVKASTSECQNVTTKLVQIRVGRNSIDHKVDVDLAGRRVDWDQTLWVEDLDVPQTGCWVCGEGARDLSCACHHVCNVTVGVVDTNHNVLKRKIHTFDDKLDIVGEGL